MNPKRGRKRLLGKTLARGENEGAITIRSAFSKKAKKKAM